MSCLQTLMRYKLWANELLYSAVADLPQEELNAPRPIVFESIIRTLNHTFAMDRVWQAHLRNRHHGFTPRNPDNYPTLSKLRTAQRKLDVWYVSYADSLSESDRDEVVSFTFIGGGTGSMSREDILIHVVSHGTYHRGNVTGMMYECSVQPPTTDCSVFLRCNQALQTDAATRRRRARR